MIGATSIVSTQVLSSEMVFRELSSGKIMTLLLIKVGQTSITKENTSQHTIW